MSLAIQKSDRNYDDFKQMLFEIFHAESSQDLPFEKVHYVFEIFKHSQGFLFADKDERVSNLLILSACLYAVKEEKNVCFISPTYFYAEQAARMRTSYMKALGASEKAKVSVVVPGLLIYEQSVQESETVFMHGKDFSDYLPEGWTGRKIIQIFPEENVPVDPIRHSRCIYDCD